MAPRTRSNKTKSAAASAEAKAAAHAASQMLISYTPGEECRVAVVEGGQLEEFHAERASNISRVGNIYVGTVTNVEPAIQAAFIDFGIEHHGFLHVSDVHPRYFPGESEEDTTESIGRKTPRRERPPIQRCFRRGDQVEVQVLKEGVGTKGPTLTSYLSIPGRFLVMMPQMDKVGVSRKVEDEDQRREMREILDQLELPEGFGFILRTAGMDRTKLELKRDLAYLQRLWKDMETRKASGNKPRLLYSESDLLVRALRDILAPEIEEVIIDNELALTRAARFLKIVAPRSKVRLLQYQGHTPLFHAFGVEQQIAQIHAREVPLPSGGRIVIDETEALVAIDVNSGKSRESRDAETNAYHTNLEAVDVICRQLKLRDLGGIVINDLIDMRHASHRKDVEARFRERLKRDRAKTTVLSISDFGILEMTRQRMRGSHESIHFAECPTCHGRGLLQKPDSVAADGLRNLAALLGQPRVSKAEMVVGPRVAGELLSGRRKTLGKIERSTGKAVDVRVLESAPMDRVSFYAYDEQGADLELDRLPPVPPPKDLKEWAFSSKDDEESWAVDVKDEHKPEAEPEFTESEQAEIAETPVHPIELDEEFEDAPGFSPSAPAGQPNGEQGGGRRRRRRRGRRGRGGGGQGGAPQGPASTPGEAMNREAPREAPEEAFAADGFSALAPGSPSGAPVPNSVPVGNGGPGGPGEGEGGGRRRRRRRRRGRGGGGVGPDGQAMSNPGAPQGAGAPQHSNAMPQPMADDDSTPRGDSWDLPASAVTPRPAPAEAIPATGAPVEDQDDAGFEGEEGIDESGGGDHAAAPTGSRDPGAEGGAPGEGKRRRRRRGRRGRGGGGGAGGPAAANGGPVDAREGPLTNERAGGDRTGGPPPVNPGGGHRDRGEVRTGGGYQRRAPGDGGPSSAPPAQGGPGPASSAPGQPSGASGSGAAPQPEAKPMRFLYSSRRKLSPGEAAKSPRRE